MLKIVESLFTKNECYKTARKMKPAGIIVHSTGANNPYLKRYCDNEKEFGKNLYGNHWNQFRPNGQQICCHAFVGYDINNKIKVAHTLPYDYCCWNCGSGSKGSYNFSPAYIQFEICEDGKTDKNYFNNVFDIAADYCVYLCKKFNIPISKVISHKEANKQGYASAHGDPDHWLANFGKTMDDFRKLVQDKLDGKTTNGLLGGVDEKVVKCTKKYKAISNARIRTIKSEFGSVTGNVKNGTIYDVDEITYINGILKWLHFKNGGYSMYVDTDNKTKLFSEVYITTTKTVNANCNFRSSTVIDKSNVICVVPKGTAIKYVKYYDKVANGKTWCKVKYNNTYGWIAKECINF